MRVFNAVISGCEPYEAAFSVHDELGLDVQVLTARQLEAANRIAPEAAWQHVGETEMQCTVGNITYSMFMTHLELVC